MTYTITFCLIIGVCMIAQWLFFILTGNVPELESEPVRIAFHLTAEAATAIALVFSAWLLRRKARNARTAATFALGMLAYTSIVSPGYFAQFGQWPFVVMFAVLLVLTGFALRQVWRNQ